MSVRRAVGILVVIVVAASSAGRTARILRGASSDRATRDERSFHLELVGGERTLEVWGTRDGRRRTTCAVSAELGAGYLRHDRTGAQQAVSREAWLLMSVIDRPLVVPEWYDFVFDTGLDLQDLWLALEGANPDGPSIEVSVGDADQQSWRFEGGREVRWSRWAVVDGVRVPTRVASNDGRNSFRGSVYWDYVRSDDSDEDLREWCPEPFQQVMREVEHTEPGGQR